MKKKYVYIWSLLRDALYPPVCPVCGKVNRTGNLCPDCRKKIRPVSSPVCFCCGKALADDRKEYCDDCSRQERRIDQGAGVFLYHSPVLPVVMNLKYHNRRVNAVFLGGAMAAYAGERLKIWQPQVILPVPVHRLRRRLRGYNQAELLAREISRRTGIPLDTHTLCRKNSTRAQKELGAAERRKNLAEAFYISSDRLSYERVLLVDDIYTTGSTADVIAGILKEAGVRQVFVLCACIGSEE